jgi:hypothetical protein
MPAPSGLPGVVHPAINDPNCVLNFIPISETYRRLEATQAEGAAMVAHLTADTENHNRYVSAQCRRHVVAVET